MRMSLFLDWFGVLADNNLMTRHWRRVEATLLQQKYGGRMSHWLTAHDRAFRWYLNYWSQYEPGSRASYRKLWRHCETEWMKRTLTWAGIQPPQSERQLFKLDRELTYEVTSRIDVAYPYARKVLKNLERRGFRLFLTSGADSTYIKGALEATKLGKLFERAFSPDTLDAFKGSLRYWKKILKLSRSDPASSIVVDDRARFLRLPTKLGVRAILVGSNGMSDRRFIKVRDVRGLLSADVLPNLKKRASQPSLGRIA